MKWIFLVLFILTAAVHLKDSYDDDLKRRRYTKPCLIFLIMFYCFSAEKVNGFLLAALVFSWIGDVLLIPNGNKWFIIGGVSFLLGHLFFILTYCFNITSFSKGLYLIIPLLIIYALISLKIISMVRERIPKMMAIAMYLYLIMNSLMNMFSLLQLISQPGLCSFIAFIGAVFFFISDCALFLLRYAENRDIIFHHHFTVMLFYLGAELLITIGMMNI